MLAEPRRIGVVLEAAGKLSPVRKSKKGRHMMKMGVPKTLWWAVGSIVLMLVGAFGPWAKVLGIVTVNGTDDGNDGWIVVGAAAVAVIVIGSFVRWPRRWLLTLSVLAGVAGAATAAYDINNINGLAPASESLFGGVSVVDAGWGIYLALISSISLIVASIALWIASRGRIETTEFSETQTPAHS
jgi:hypothetical protein